MGYRVHSRTGSEWLGLLARRLERFGAEVVVGGADAAAYFAIRGGEAATIADETEDGGATLLFRDSQPTASAVLEEVAHLLQSRRRSFADEDFRVMECRRELEAKLCLADRRVRLAIPEGEHEETVRQLKAYEAKLISLTERWS